MNWDIQEVVIGLLGGGGMLSGVAALVIYLFNLKSEKRIRKAAARKTELEGDLLSVEYFQETIKGLVSDNTQLKKDVQELKQKVRELEQGKSDSDALKDKYAEAGKECHTCEYNTDAQPCPAITKFNELTR
jgi:phage shock protein A